MRNALLFCLFALLLASMGVFLIWNPVGVTVNVGGPGTRTVTLQAASSNTAAAPILAPGAAGVVRVLGDTNLDSLSTSTLSEPVATDRNLESENLNLPPVTVLENVRTTIRSYFSMFGGNPIGSNEEITQALNGGNPKQVKFLNLEANRLNIRGELVDFWGTPYFFHQLSGKEMEIRSAGPDQKLWTEDDLVTR